LHRQQPIPIQKQWIQLYRYSNFRKYVGTSCQDHNQIDKKIGIIDISAISVEAEEKRMVNNSTEMDTAVGNQYSSFLVNQSISKSFRNNQNHRMSRILPDTSGLNSNDTKDYTILGKKIKPSHDSYLGSVKEREDDKYTTNGNFKFATNKTSQLGVHHTGQPSFSGSYLILWNAIHILLSFET